MVAFQLEVVQVEEEEVEEEAEAEAEEDVDEVGLTALYKFDGNARYYTLIEMSLFLTYSLNSVLHGNKVGVASTISIHYQLIG